MPARGLLQDAEMDLTSSDDGFWEQPEGQSEPADMPSDDTLDTLTYADSSNDDQLENSGKPLSDVAFTSAGSEC